MLKHIKNKSTTKETLFKEQKKISPILTKRKQQKTTHTLQHISISINTHKETFIIYTEKNSTQSIHI